MGKQEKKMRKAARETAKMYVSIFDDGKIMFCNFVEQLNRKDKRTLIKAIKKGSVRELLLGDKNEKEE